MKRTTAFAIFFGVVVAAHSGVGHSQILSKQVPVGASFGQVLGIWGEPLDKVDKSVKGEVVWYYPDGAKVVFKNGRVRAWRPTDALLAQRKEFSGSKIPATPAVAAQLSAETRDLVRDIAKEVPSGPDVPVADSPPLGSSNQPPLIPNQVPPGGRGAPPGVFPGEVMLDDGEED